MGLIRLGTGTLAFFGLFATHSFADDWLMYRKDAGRTAASSDRVRLPLKEAWTWTSQRVGGVAPLSTVVVRGSSAYFFTGPKAGEVDKKAARMLVSVNTATGAVEWVQPMESTRMHSYLHEDVGPVVSTSGTVFAIDMETVYRPCPQATFVVRAFDGGGKPVDKLVVPVKDTLSRFFLRDGHGEANYLLAGSNKPAT
jgi:hypothetical protein